MTCEAARSLVDATALSLLESSLQAHRFAREYLAEIDQTSPALTDRELNIWRIYARGAEEAAREHREALDRFKDHFSLHGGRSEGAARDTSGPHTHVREAPEVSS